ncbi:NEDD4 family-interacting protein 1-like [Scaptodrosophila lebanonensis]|uniref:NEDD4 family-interacting protein 1-like n=1 Tax=Drosophila lebanonensis TaxID=7225 RepID=A0A6J2UAF4_DROLE|nr:NEDD4 family-interacting protein 1-like [Scaptodrosophila lebanonensis]
MPQNNQRSNGGGGGGGDDQLGPPKADFSAPPPYEPATIYTGGQQVALPPQLPSLGLTSHASSEAQQQDNALVEHNAQQLSQELHGKLPTYEEVQMEKSLNGELPPAFLTLSNTQQLPPPPNPLLPPNPLRDGAAAVRAAQPALTFIAIDASDPENSLSTTDNLLGTDIMFITAFMVAFLFNWIGFLMLTCFCHTIAARYGALSGFGLSLAKWTLIVKHSTDLASHENTWLWWLIMAFGFLICVRAIIQYVSIKRTWRLLSAPAQERLLFFY